MKYYNNLQLCGVVKLLTFFFFFDYTIVVTINTTCLLHIVYCISYWSQTITILICQVNNRFTKEISMSWAYILKHYNKLGIELAFKIGAFNTYIYTYSPSVRVTAQFLTLLMLCLLIVYVSAGTYSLTSTPNNRNLLSWNCRRNIFFTFGSAAWPGIQNRGFTSNKPTYYLLAHGVLFNTANGISYWECKALCL